MATPFTDVYSLFLSQITDYDLAKMPATSVEDNMELWLFSAIGFFSSCRQDLFDFDLTVKQFNSDLNHVEKQIISKFMVVAYLDTHLIKEDLMKQSLNSKDYRMYSPANQIKALIELKSKINSEANTLISRYSYNVQSLKDLFK